MYLLIGAGGFLGSYVIKHIIEDTDDRVIAFNRNGQVYCKENVRVLSVSGDICNEDDVKKLADISMQHENLKVIYLCAQHNIDLVAKDPDKAYSVNVKALENVLNSLKNIKCLFFASSDTVYGEGGDYRFKESDKLNPISIYGRHKASGEQSVLSHGFNVLRLPFMFGKSLSPYKKHFCDELIRKFSCGESANMFIDSIRSTLSFDTVGKIFIILCEHYSEQLPKVLNVSGDEALSKYNVGIRLAESINADSSLAIPTKSAGTWLPGAERAESTLMDNSMLKKQLGINELRFDIV